MLEPGTDIGAYRIDGLLGRGGMGVVYEATQHSLGRKVALKLLAAELSRDESFRSRFRREGRIQAGLDHAHIVPIYEAGELEEHGLFIAMRLVRGATLKDLVRRRELDPRRTVTVLTPVADALDTAHEADLVHRDIKPQNILVGRRDHTYLADFGLTRAPGDTAFTKTGQFVGTLDYVAPEQIRGEAPGPSSDLYSFAAVAFECLTGSVPFPKHSDAAVMFAHISDPPPRASELRPELSPAVDEVLVAGLAKAPGDRPKTLLEFVAALDDALGDSRLDIPSVPPPPASSPSRVAAADAPTVLPARIVAPGPAEPAPAVSLANTIVPGPDEQAATVSPARDAPAVRDAGDRTGVHARRGVATRADRRRDWPARDAAGAPSPASAAVAPAPAAAPSGTSSPSAVVAPARLEPSHAPAGRRRGRALPLVAATAALLVLAAGAGIFAGGAGEKPAPAAAPPLEPTRFTAGPLTLAGPPGWARRDAPELPGIDLRDAAAVGDGEATMVAGMTDPAGPTLLSAGNPTGAVALGRAQGYRLVDDDVTLLAAPTTAGVAVVACLGSAGERARCEAAAASLALQDGVRAFKLGASERYARELKAPLDRLARDRRAGLRVLRAAKRPGGQARAAAGIASTYRETAKRLAAVAPNLPEREAHRALRAAAGRAARAYDALAAAARQNKRSGYARAARQARAAERRVNRGIERLRSFGYRVS